MDNSNRLLTKDGYLTPSVLQLKALRKEVGLSQECVANRCAELRLPLSIASLKRAESGHSISYRTARALADFYEVRIVDLLLNG